MPGIGLERHHWHDRTSSWGHSTRMIRTPRNQPRGARSPSFALCCPREAVHHPRSHPHCHPARIAKESRDTPSALAGGQSKSGLVHSRSRDGADISERRAGATGACQCHAMRDSPESKIPARGCRSSVPFYSRPCRQGRW